MKSHSLLAACALAAHLGLIAATPELPSGKQPITIEHLWQLQRMDSPALSPDGKWAAVEVSSFDMKENTSASDIWLLATDGSTQRKLTSHSSRDGSPQWSPDGREIAFVSKRDGDDQAQIYLISPEGGEARRLTKVSTGVSAIKWFPDSKQIAFISWVWTDLEKDEDQGKRLKQRQEAKVKAIAIETTTFRYWDHWFGDGRVPHLFVANTITGGHRDLMTKTELSLLRNDLSTGLSAGLYDISPDGLEVAFTTDLGKDPGADPASDILTLDIAGGAWKKITSDNPANDSNPRYSPDGKWIAYTRQAIKHFYADRERLVLHDRKTGHNSVLTESWDRTVGSPAWAPDSQRILFLAEDQGQQHLWSLGLKDKKPDQLAQGGAISTFSVSANGKRLAFARSDLAQPGAIHAAESDGSGVRRLDRFNDELTRQWQLGEVKTMKFKGFGGKTVEMFVVFPPGFDAKKKWPLLQMIHGGPHNAWLDQFHFRWNPQVFAAPGYVVALVNYHGSSGWGQAFTDSITADYGRREFEDVEKATDHLIAQGYIDKDRLTAAGGSYGGFMVAWMNGHTDRYQAYVCHAGVYNWVSMMGSDVIRGRERALGAFPWDNPAKVLKQSPHSYAKHFNTPTLVVHGEQDFRVPVSQGFEYYSTLRAKGVPARLLYYPDENHWVLKPQNAKLWTSEFMGWIGRYVPPGGR